MKKSFVKTVVSAFLAIILVLSLCACGQGGAAKPAPTTEPAAAEAAQAQTAAPAPEPAAESAEENSEITIVDLAGRTHTFAKPVDKFIDQKPGAGGCFFTACALLGDELCDHLVGWDDCFTTLRTDFYNHFLQDMPELADIPLVGLMNADNFDLEKVLTSGAECVFTTRLVYESAKDTVVPKLEKAGIQVVVLDFQAQTYEKHMQSIEIIGKILGREKRVKEIMDFYTRAVEDIYPKIDGLLAANNNVRPVVYIEYGMAGGAAKEFSNSYSNAQQWGGIVYSLGGTSLADGQGEGGQPIVDPEYILSSDPDMILLSAVSPTSKEQAEEVGGSIYVGFDVPEEAIKANRDLYKKRPGWENLKAVKNDKIYVVPHPIHREVFDCASIQAVAKLLWPEEFKDLDPIKTYEDFWAEFMPFTISGIWYCGY